MMRRARFLDHVIHVPPYRVGTWGEWEMSNPAAYEKAGYWSDRVVQFSPFVLRRGDVTWMSTSLMEMESQQHHMALAYGHTVIGGLGMGLVTFNVALNPRVTRVVVVERDPVIIEAFNHFTFSTWPKAVRDKVRIVNKSVFDFRPSAPVDALIMDIWPVLGDDNGLPDTQRVQRMVNARSVGYWGQEYDFLVWCMGRKIPPSAVALRHWQTWSREINLPMMPHDDPAYPALALHAISVQTFDPKGRGIERIPVTDVGMAAALRAGRPRR